MKCKLCAGDVKVEGTIVHNHVAVRCLNPQCKRYMIKHFVRAEESEKKP